MNRLLIIPAIAATSVLALTGCENNDVTLKDIEGYQNATVSVGEYAPSLVSNEEVTTLSQSQDRNQMSKHKNERFTKSRDMFQDVEQMYSDYVALYEEIFVNIDGSEYSFEYTDAQGMEYTVSGNVEADGNSYLFTLELTQTEENRNSMQQHSMQRVVDTTIKVEEVNDFVNMTIVSSYDMGKDSDRNAGYSTFSVTADSIITASGATSGTTSTYYIAEYVKGTDGYNSVTQITNVDSELFDTTYAIIVEEDENGSYVTSQRSFTASIADNTQTKTLIDTDIYDEDKNLVVSYETVNDKPFTNTDAYKISFDLNAVTGWSTYEENDDNTITLYDDSSNAITIGEYTLEFERSADSSEASALLTYQGTDTDVTSYLDLATNIPELTTTLTANEISDYITSSNNAVSNTTILDTNITDIKSIEDIISLLGITL